MQQKLENFCKIFVVDAGYLRFNSFFCHRELNIRHCFLAFFVIDLSTVALSVLDGSFNCSNSLSWIMTHSLRMHHIIKQVAQRKHHSRLISSKLN